MSDRQLTTILNSGEVNTVFLGGTAGADKVVKQSGLDATNGNIVSLTSDVADIVDGTTPLAKTILTDQTGTEPAYVEGQVFYANGTTNIHGAYSDVTLQVGREQQIEVLNNTGSTITNGQACKHSGASAGTIIVSLAIADTFANARVLGVATHDIPSGQKGLLTTFGSVGDVNTLGLLNTLPLYLSDTVAGGFTNTAPDIITRVGGITLVDAAGEVFVTISNNMSLPIIFGNMNGGAIPTTLTQNIETIVNTYSSEDSISMTTNTGAGLISVPSTGRYKAIVNIELSYAAISNAYQQVEVIIEANDGTDQRVAVMALASSSSFSSEFITTSVQLTAGKDYHIKLQPIDSTLTSTAAKVEFDLESIHIR